MRRSRSESPDSGDSLHDCRRGRNSIPCALRRTAPANFLTVFAVALKEIVKATLLQHHGLIACEENLEQSVVAGA